MKYFLFIIVAVLSMSFVVNKTYTTNQLIGKSQVQLYGTHYKLQKEVYFALEKMRKEAKKQGIKIKVVSAYRGFEHQKKIWNRKYTKFISQGYSSVKAIEKVKEYTAIPGTSRHHWGTDVDLTNGVSSLTNTKKGKFLNWMDENAHKFGFYRTYTKNKFRKGYNYESWHYSYRKIAKPMLTQYLKLDIVKILSKQDIKGNTYFTNNYLSKYIENNVLGINTYLY